MHSHICKMQKVVHCKTRFCKSSKADASYICTALSDAATIVTHASACKGMTADANAVTSTLFTMFVKQPDSTIFWSSNQSTDKKPWHSCHATGTAVQGELVCRCTMSCFWRCKRLAVLVRACCIVYFMHVPVHPCDICMLNCCFQCPYNTAMPADFAGMNT